MLSTYGTAVDKATGTYQGSFAILNTAALSAPPLLLGADPRVVVNNNNGGQFTPGGKALVCVIRGENNVDNLWSQPLDGKPGRQLTTFKSDQIYRFSWSPNGKKLVVGRGHSESDVVLLGDTSK